VLLAITMLVLSWSFPARNVACAAPLVSLAL
jgi:hypothetical protein